MMKSLNINHLSGLKENMLITTSDKLTSLSVNIALQKRCGGPMVFPSYENIAPISLYNHYIMKRVKY